MLRKSMVAHHASGIKLLSYLQPTVSVFLYSLAKKLALSPMVSAMSGVYRDGLVLGLYTPCPGFQPL